jgi:hypothetical protein
MQVKAWTSASLGPLWIGEGGSESWIVRFGAKRSEHPPSDTDKMQTANSEPRRRREALIAPIIDRASQNLSCETHILLPA